MASDSEHLPQYIEHLEARLRARRGQSTPQDGENDLAVLPDDLKTLCTTEPRRCLELVVRVLQQTADPEVIEEVGDDLLENLLNENSALLQPDVLHHLRSNRRFRQAFACGNYSSVDPAVISEWVNVFEELGTTKSAERKGLWARPG